MAKYVFKKLQNKRARDHRLSRSMTSHEINRVVDHGGKMTLRKIIETARTKKKEPCCVWTMAEKLDIYEPLSEPETVRLEEVWVSHWLCTDTKVGEKVYFLDGAPVAFSCQPARKSDEDIKWLSKDAYKVVEEYLESLREREEFVPTLSESDLDEDYDDHYHVDYASQLLPSTQGYAHDGAELEYVRDVPNQNEFLRSAGISEAAVFKKNGETVELELSEVNIRYFDKED